MSTNQSNPARAFRVARFTSVVDEATFQRGAFTLELYVDRHDHVGYEVRHYHDSVELIATNEVGTRQGRAQITLTHEFVLDQGLRHGFDQAFDALQRLVPSDA